jgi:hypothetical protein
MILVEERRSNAGLRCFYVWRRVKVADMYGLASVFETRKNMRKLYTNFSNGLQMRAFDEVERK